MPRHLTILTGASRGMGLAMAQQLLQPDATLITLSRGQNPALDAQARQVGAVLEQWQVDLAEPQAAAQRLQGWLAERGGETDGAHFASATLINNAGVISALVPLQAADAADLSRALRVGLEAPMLLCAAFLSATGHWVAPRKILNVSSGLGRRAMASSASYCAAKAGMDHFTRCLALEEAGKPRGARVCSLAPGVIDTAMQVQLRGADPQHFADQAGFAALHAKGQLTDPAEAARRLLAFLARPDFGAEPVADIRTAEARP